jgi:hypothetical protein
MQMHIVQSSNYEVSETVQLAFGVITYADDIVFGTAV